MGSLSVKKLKKKKEKPISDLAISSIVHTTVHPSLSSMTTLLEYSPNSLCTSPSFPLSAHLLPTHYFLLDPVSFQFSCVCICPRR